MSDENASRVLGAFPTQLLEGEGWVRLRRGCVEVRITGERVNETVHQILGLTDGRRATREEICDSFAAIDRAAVRDLIAELEKRRILTAEEEFAPHSEGDETALDIFYWHFGESTKSVTDRLCSQRIVILGVNTVSRQLIATLAEAGIKSVEVIDHPMMRNLRLFDSRGQLVSRLWTGEEKPISYEKSRLEPLGCLVATSDFGGAQLFREWNSFCIERKCHFFPVTVQDLIGYVGPLTVPGETACFECLRSRWNSNLDGQESRWDLLGFEAQRFVGFHPAMCTVVAGVAAFELTKFYGMQLPFAAVGRLIEINLLTMQMESHRVLKIPYCSACSALNTTSPTSLTPIWFGLRQTEEA